MGSKYLKLLKVYYDQQLREITTAFAFIANTAIMVIGKFIVTFPFLRTLLMPL